MSSTSLALDGVLLVLIVHLRRHRPLQRAGVTFLACLLLGCMLGHVASLMDGLPLSGAVCRSKMGVIYACLYALLAPLLGKLASLCRAAQNVLLAGHTTGWDTFAQKVTATVLGVQLMALLLYLGLTAGKATRDDRLQTVCSENVSEHAFHFIDGLLTVRRTCVAMREHDRTHALTRSRTRMRRARRLSCARRS